MVSQKVMYTVIPNIFWTGNWCNKTSSFTGEISSDIVTPISDFAYVTLNNVKPAKKELVFIASEVPPLGIKSYLVQKKFQANEDHQNLTDILKFGNEVITHSLLRVEGKNSFN